MNNESACEMAYCPKCRGEMVPTAIACPHCGYDFPASEGVSQRSRGFAYSPLADLALVVSMIAAVFGAVGAAIAAILAVIHGQFLNGFFVYPVFALVLLGILVVFLRVQE